MFSLWEDDHLGQMVTAHSLGCVMSMLVVQELHLWLCLADMRDADKIRFLNSPVSKTGLFSDTVKSFAQQFLAAQKQTEAIKHIMPSHAAAASTSTESSERAVGGSRVKPFHAPSAHPWNQVSVAQHTQTPLRATPEPTEPGLCVPPRCPTMGICVGPLVPLTWPLRAWLVLPSSSRWLLWTTRQDYAIQFTSHPPKFRSIHFTLVKELVPPANMRTGFTAPTSLYPRRRVTASLGPVCLELRLAFEE
ncbi:hypothetical protein M9458_025247, partial [Cirrhinus mrigala]